MAVDGSKRLYVSIKNIHSKDVERVLGIVLDTFKIQRITVHRYLEGSGSRGGPVDPSSPPNNYYGGGSE